MNKMRFRIAVIIALALGSQFSTMGQDLKLPLYTNTIPNSKASKAVEKLETKYEGAVSAVTVPEISVYLPTTKFSTGQAIVICPGGGYWIESMTLEGRDIARYLSSIGVTAVVLKYRLPMPETCVDQHKVPLMDAQRAIRMVRANSVKWGVNPQKVGVMGFSAGGHLASTVGTHFDDGDKSSTDSVERISSRPDFMVLIYPVISMADSITHKGSRRLLLGDKPSSELVKLYSNELQVKENTPPTFIVHANDDSVVPVENAILMYEALHKKKVPCEIHILSEGEHGFGLGVNKDHVGFWTEDLKLWLKSINGK
jgi:acetyl esterase/lipase